MTHFLIHSALLVALAVVAAAPRAGAQVSPSYSFPPLMIRQELIHYSDPPPANPPPIPPYVWGPATAGLENRNFRVRATQLSTAGKAKAAGVSAAGANAEAPKAGGAFGSRDLPGDGFNGSAVAEAIARQSRRLHAERGTPMRPRPGGSGASGNGTSNPGQERETSASSWKGFAFGGVGLARPIRGTSIGFDGIGVPETRLVPEDLSLAVGTTGAIHTANSMIRFYRVDVAGKLAKYGPNGGPQDSSTLLKSVWLADFFYSVTKRTDGSNGCNYGVFAATVAYDKWVGRYMISAICDDVEFPYVLLAVSAVDSVTDYWNLYAVPATNEVTSWTCANGERALPDYSQVGYNRDGIYVTWTAICSEGLIVKSSAQVSSMLYAFPKWAVYGGNNPQLLGKRFHVPVWTGVEVCQAVANQVPNRLPGGADCGAAFSQLQPVMPQTANDVRAGETFFVLDYWYDDLTRRRFLLVALIATGTLWDHDGLRTPTPYLVGRFVDRGQDCIIQDDVYLLQDQQAMPNAPDLDGGAVNPRGYWNGGAAYANGRIYIADRTDVVDPPYPPPQGGGPTTVPYSPRPAIYWAWVQPTFTAYGPCACYWNFNWGYGYGWLWDKGCYNPVTGMTTAGGGGAYMSSRGRRLLGQQQRLGGGWSTAPYARDRSAIVPANGTATAGGGGGGVGRLGAGGVAAAGANYGGAGATRPRQPNVVYTAALGAVEHTIRSQAPKGSKVIVPPPGEVAAAALRPEAVTPEVVEAAETVTSQLDGGNWGTVEAAGAGLKSGAGAGKWRDVYMAQAYYNPSYNNWGIEFRCRFGPNWNERNTVTLLATVIKSGVITHGSATGEAAFPLGLAYPQVAVRGGTMLVTYTYSSFANIQPTIPGVQYTDAPAYAGVGFTLIDATTRQTQVNVAHQQDPSYGPIVQPSQRFGDYAGIDIHPISGRIWSANLFSWAPAYTVDGLTVLSNAGARITIFS